MYEETWPKIQHMTTSFVHFSFPHLKSSPLSSVFLVVCHGLQHFLVSVGDQTHSPKNLQHRNFGLDVLRPQALWDGVDALWMSQHVRTALRVVHQGLDAADDGGVDAALWRLVVHAAQEVEEAGKAVQFDEACDKPWGL